MCLWSCLYGDCVYVCAGVCMFVSVCVCLYGKCVVFICVSGNDCMMVVGVCVCVCMFVNGWACVVIVL